jgi:hypothetical protein
MDQTNTTKPVGTPATVATAQVEQRELEPVVLKVRTALRAGFFWDWFGEQTEDD